MVWMQTEEVFSHLSQPEDTPSGGGDSNITIDNQPISTIREVPNNIPTNSFTYAAYSSQSAISFYTVYENTSLENNEIILNWISYNQPNSTNASSSAGYIELLIYHLDNNDNKIIDRPGIFASATSCLEFLNQRVTIEPGQILAFKKYNSGYSFTLTYSLISNHN